MNYEQYLDRCVDDLFNVAYNKWTWKEWAEEAGVSYSTVKNLGTRKTRRPQLRTVFLLAKSLGVNLPSVLAARNTRKLRRKVA